MYQIGPIEDVLGFKKVLITRDGARSTNQWCARLYVTAGTYADWLVTDSHKWFERLGAAEDWAHRVLGIA